MKVLVPIKRVVDYMAKVRVNPSDNKVDLSNVKMSINPFCEIALEESIKLKEKGIVSQIFTVSIGPEKAQDILRSSLALGADNAVLVKTDQRIDSEIQKHDGSKELIKVKSRPLKEIFEEYSVTKVDYLSIDTEGSEYNILRSIDFDAVDVRVISTENSSRSDIRALLEGKGFVFATQCCGDEIYYRE